MVYSVPPFIVIVSSAKITVIKINKFKWNIPKRLFMAEVIKLKDILIRITDKLQIKKQPRKSLKLRWTDKCICLKQ